MCSAFDAVARADLERSGAGEGVVSTQLHGHLKNELGVFSHR